MTLKAVVERSAVDPADLDELILATASAVGITALLTASEVAYNLVRIAGGQYLIFLGLQAFHSWLRLRRNHAA